VLGIAATTPFVLRPDSDLVEQVLTASRARRVLDCTGPDGRTPISADDLREACLASAADLDPFGIRIANGVVEGTLDLRAAAVAVPLQFLGCVFTHAPHLDGADLHELVIAGGRHAEADLPVAASRLPGLLANGLRLRRDLVLSGTEISGEHANAAAPERFSAIWLTEAEIGGRLLLLGTVINTTAARAIQADRTVVIGDVRLNAGFRANAGVRLHAMQIGGSVTLMGATITTTTGRALDLIETAIRGSLFLLQDENTGQRTTIHGRVELGRASIQGGVRIGNARLAGLPGAPSLKGEYHHIDAVERVCLVAPGLSVQGPMVIGGDTEIDGAVILAGAELRSGAVLDGVTLRNGGDLALDLSQAQLAAGLSLRGTHVEGTIDVGNARIGGPLSLIDARLSAPRDHLCLTGTGTRVEGGVTIRWAHAQGGIDLRGSIIAGGFDAEGAKVINPGHESLSLRQARIQGNVRLCAGFTSVGLVILTRASVEGRLRCDGADLAWVNPQAGDSMSEVNPRGLAFEAIAATFSSGISLGWQIRAGGVDLSYTQTTFLADDPATDWPRQSRLAGFSYQRFGSLDPSQSQGEWRPQVRARWLAGMVDYDPRPWSQVATVLRASGNGAGAEDLLIAQRRCERRRRIGTQRRRWRRALDVLVDVTIGYGYRPERVLLIMVALIAAVSLSLIPTGWQSSMRAVDPAGVIYTPAGVLPGAGVSQPGQCGEGKVRCFNPVLYAVDTVIPIVDLKQRSTWYPSRDTGSWLEWWLSLATLLGWLTSTVFALSFTRLGRSGSS
jgi:hypothetical protein